MSSLENTILIFLPSVLAGVAAYVLTKDLGDLLSIEQRPFFRLRFAAMAACTAFCFISYFMWTVGMPFDLAVFWPGGKTTYPWWVLPLTLGVSVLWYRTLSKNTTTFGER
ncbi:MAG: hypothetical protein ACYCSS_10175 [Sulfuriferula sp.]